MEIYQQLTSLWNIATSLFSFITTFILLKKFPEKVYGMCVILRFGIFLSVISILFYASVIVFKLPTEITSLFGRPLVGLLNSIVGLISVSQLMKIKNDNNK